MNPIHVILQLFQIFDVSVANFTNHESTLALLLPWLTRARGQLLGRRVGSTNPLTTSGAAVSLANTLK